jgi:hypothetical protein
MPAMSQRVRFILSPGQPLCCPCAGAWFLSIHAGITTITSRRSQGLSAVSFDKNLYPFVKTYLEPLLPEDTVFHTWDLNIGLHKTDFLSRTRSRDYFNDDRVKTILYAYKSQFEL